MDCENKDNKSNCNRSIDIGRGCKFCNCTKEVRVGACEGCYKLHETNWLEEYPNLLPDDIVEIRFKNTRKSFYRNVNNLPLKEGDIVTVEALPGHDVGIVSLTGDIVYRQMKRVGFTPMNGEFKKVYRKAKPYDIEKWQEAIALEHTTMIRSRQIAADMKLNMKIGDVEYQGDKIKAIFYYIADERVDFRELIKVFADQFRIRVEMKQIGARQEAGRIGGLGSCGRQLCCASWMSGFASVTTNAARVQDISLNPQKLAGQCGKLKCCLIHELDVYLDARSHMPRVDQPLQVLDGEYTLVKTDILAGTMTFSTSATTMTGLVTISADRVREIMALNRRGKKADRLDVAEVKREVKIEDIGFLNVVGEESITRFDRQKGDRNNRNRKNRRGDKPNGDGAPEKAGEQNGNRTVKNGSGDRQRNDRPRNNNRQDNSNGNRPSNGENNNRNGKPRSEGDNGQPRHAQSEGRERRSNRAPKPTKANSNNGGWEQNGSAQQNSGENKPNSNRSRSRGRGGKPRQKDGQGGGQNGEGSN